MAAQRGIMQRDRTKPVLAPVPALPRLISRLP